MPNRMSIRIQPEEDIQLRFQAKQPGPTLHLRPVQMRILVQGIVPGTDAGSLRDAVARRDSLRRHAVHARRSGRGRLGGGTAHLGSVEPATPSDFPNYAAGTWGPEEADELLARDGCHWLAPDLHNRD